MPGRPPATSFEQHFSALPYDSGRIDGPHSDKLADHVAKEMPVLAVQTPRPFGGVAHTPREQQKSVVNVTSPHVEQPTDVHQENNMLLSALGNYLQDVGRTLTQYSSVENDVHCGVKVLQPGTLRSLQFALSSVVPGDSITKGDYLVQSVEERSSTGCRPRVKIQSENMEQVPCRAGVPVAAISEAHASPEDLHLGKTVSLSEHVESMRTSTIQSMWADRDEGQQTRSRWKETAKTRSSMRKSAVAPRDSLPPGKKFARNVGELLVAAVIALNAIVLGLTADYEWDGWQFIEYFFTAFFTLEMFLKFYLQGVRGYFMGPDCWWNIFDFVLVIIAGADLALTEMYSGEGSSNAALSKFTIIKIVRLARLGRLVRLLRFKMFKELTAMINGVCSGLRVLLWAIVLLFVLIYILGIALRQLIDEDDPLLNQQLKKGFGTLPAAMNTLFMCFTDGCVASDGTPIPVHFYDEFGLVFMISYCLVMLFITIGVFNLIMAIFVDNVLERGRQRKMEQRAIDRGRLEKRLRQVVRNFASEYSDSKLGLLRKQHKSFRERVRSAFSLHPDQATFSFSDFARSLYESWICSQLEDDGSDHSADDTLVITRHMFCDLLAAPEMERMLANLEIETSTRDELFDILDADMSGELDFDELIVGLMTLRGPAEKKDAIGALLCIRASQVYLREMQEQAEEQMNKLILEVKKVERISQRFMQPSVSE